MAHILYAIYKVVIYSKETFTNQKILICSDNLSSINALKNKFSNKINIQMIFDEIHNSNNFYFFMWIPSHTGIKYNEKADELAKLATNIENFTQIPLPLDY
jgi:ribonuclease HI